MSIFVRVMACHRMSKKQCLNQWSATFVMPYDVTKINVFKFKCRARHVHVNHKQLIDDIWNVFMNWPWPDKYCSVCCISITWVGVTKPVSSISLSWWRHRMETLSASLARCGWNPSVSGGFPSQRPVTRSFDVFFDLRMNKRLNKHSRLHWFETPSRSLSVTSL